MKLNDEYDSLLQSRARGAYLGLAVGDAMGATVEFMTAREIAVELGSHKDITGGGWLHLKAGDVTDDTTMSHALGHAIIEQGKVEAEAVADAFNCWLRGKPVDVGNTVRKGIVNYRLTGETEAPKNYYDAGNGACMRSLPIALTTYGQDSETVKQASRLQAHVTHHNDVSDAGCECIISMVQGALDSQSKSEFIMGPIQKLIAKYPEYAFRGRHRDNPTAYIVETLQAVFQAMFDSNSFEECLINVVNRGGDADTTGAIAGMIAGSLYGVESIPERWLKALNQDIKQVCEFQADALMSLALSRNQKLNAGRVSKAY